jgi:hypothetical protein
MDHNKLCERVFALNEDIRYAGVIDSTGTLVAGGMRKGTDSIVSETDEELFLTHTALRKSMRDRFDTSMGGARFALEANVDSHTAIDIADDTLELLNGKQS